MTYLLSLRTAFALLLVAASVALATPAQAQKRVALVIGNNDYRNIPKLLKAVNDARTMGDTLKQLGFTVMVAENQNRVQFSAKQNRAPGTENAVFERGRRDSNPQPSDRQSGQGVCKSLLQND